MWQEHGASAAPGSEQQLPAKGAGEVWGAWPVRGVNINLATGSEMRIFGFRSLLSNAEVLVARNGAKRAVLGFRCQVKQPSPRIHLFFPSPLTVF